MTKFLLIRHALTDAVGRSIAGRAPGVHVNSAGREELERLRRRLAGESVHQLFSSPLERTRQTAEVLAELWHVPLRISDELNEIDFGDWTGLSFDQLRGSPWWRQFNESRSTTRIPGGETLLEVQQRIVSFMLVQAAQHPQQHIALVSHGDVIRAALAWYLGLAIDFMTRIEIATASVSVVSIGEFAPQLNLINCTC